MRDDPSTDLTRQLEESRWQSTLPPFPRQVKCFDRNAVAPCDTD